MGCNILCFSGKLFSYFSYKICLNECVMYAQVQDVEAVFDIYRSICKLCMKYE